LHGSTDLPEASDVLEISFENVDELLEGKIRKILLTPHLRFHFNIVLIGRKENESHGGMVCHAGMDPGVGMRIEWT
jgi:hypothetical protein